MKEALIEFLQSLPEEKNGLRFFEMPTGSGKTYGAIQFMHDFICNPDQFGIKKVVYLTNLKSNLNETLGDLEKSFSENEKDLFNNNVLKITANLDCVIDSIMNVDANDEITKMPSFSDLKNQVSVLKKFEEFKCSTNEIENFKSETLAKTEKSFRYDLEKYIAKWPKCDKEISKIAKIKKNYGYLLKMYPAILTSQRKVLFLTTDKFHTGNNPIVKKAYRFTTKEEIKNTLIIIDESDKAKMHLLKRQIEKSTKYQVDLLQVVTSIQKSFETDIKPEELFIQKHETSPDKTTRASYEKTRNVFNDVFKEHNLNYQFKLSSNIESKNIFIFHDYDPMVVTSEKDISSIYIRRDDRKKLNVILKEEKNHTDTLSSLTGSLIGALNYFLRFVCMAADNYSEAKNSDVQPEQQINTEDSISTILSIFGFDQGTLDTLKRIALNVHKLTNYKSTSNELMFTYDLYEKGFQIYSFLEESSHDLNTKIMVSYLDETPEKFLKTIASYAPVACLSATATANTVLNNFNIPYLREEFDSDKLFMPRSTIERLKEQYIKSRLLKLENIKVESININEDNYIDSFSGSAVEREKLEVILNKYPNKTSQSKRVFYDKVKFVKTALAIKKFILNKDSHVMLILSPKLLKPFGATHIYNEGAFQEVINLIVRNNKKPCILSLASKNYQSFLSSYNDAVKKKGKVIIFSSFNTAGTGQNLQYSINDETGVEKKVDIDSLYLEKPTYLLTLPEKNMDQSVLSNIIYENLSLAQNSEQTYKEAKFQIKRACKIKELSEDSLDNYFPSINYNKKSVSNAGVTIVKQAIGRICRTKDENLISKNKYIYVDQDIYDSFSFEEEKSRFNTLEFQAFIECATPSTIKKEAMPTEIIEAINRCNVTRKTIRELLKTDKDRWLENYKLKYETIREFILKHPTLSREEIELHKDMAIFYLKSLNGKTNRYWFRRTNFGDDYYIEDISFSRIMNSNEASSRYLKLEKFMSFDFIKNYFIRNGYATEFIPNDYILLPNVLDDLYRGSLGEAVGKAILENKLMIELAPIEDLEKFEKFDFCLKTNKNIYIDFKFWRTSSKNDEDELAKIRQKKEKVGASAVFIISIIDDNSEHKIYRDQVDTDIIVIPWLIHDSTIIGPRIDERRCNDTKCIILETLKKYGNAY